ncbi:MAG: ATPase, T2SS/T4P/T4SS family [bacterium]|nr:ATPase, T2SS/T4P/T4SS family [bacterium]
MKTGRQNRKAFEVDELVKTIAEEILSEGFSKKATDIHIEPRENHTLVRLRIGGMLKTAKTLPLELSAKLAKYFKFLAELNFSEKTFTQIGQFSREDYRVRVSTSPVFLGEKTTLRILRKQNSVRKLDQIGLWGKNLQSVEKALSQPRGVIITFGEGKNSTNFALLERLISEEKNIVSVERQIEKILTGVNQIAINPKIGLDYPQVLHAALSQNPDVVLVDSVKDKQTAEIIFEAAMSGKLIIASLPVHKTSQVVPFLKYLGVDYFLSSANILAIIGQTLIRTTDEKNLIFEEIPPQDSQAILSDFNISAQNLHNLEIAAREYFSQNSPLKTTSASIKKLAKFPENKEIFTGSTAIFEAINLYEAPIGKDFRNFLSTQPNSSEIEEFLLENNYITIKIDGLVKSLRGQTSLKEVIRRTGF